MSLYERLGQEVGIRTAVDDFYARLVADPQVAPFFEGIDLPRLRRHQTALLSQVTGGPVEYSGRDLAAGHAGLGITDPDFDRVVGHLVATLTDLGVAEDDIGAVGAALGAHRGEIVTAAERAERAG
jgi:hemoglobin